MENNSEQPFHSFTKSKRVILIIARIVLCAVFLFSGFTKCVDPLGSAYKFTDYFEAFHLQFLEPLSLFFSFAQATAEFWLGAAVLIGFKVKIATLLLWIFMLLMTPLTLYLAIANPIADCGCFGDAWILTNWETFFKNIVLLTAASYLFYYRRHLVSLFSRHTQYVVSLYVFLFALTVSALSYHYLPMFDFRPYAIGTDIVAGMEIPEGAPSDVYENTLIYEKDGVRKHFTLDNYPADDDSTWTFVSNESKLIQKGYTPPIHDFILTSMEGEDMTETILADTSYTFLLIAPQLENASDEFADQINEIYDYSLHYNYHFYGVTSSVPAVIEEWNANTGGDYPFLLADEITLKTIIRSNPGLVLLKEGVIINKWPHTFLPDIRMLDRPLNQTSIGELIVTKSKARNLFFIFVFVFPLLLLLGIEKTAIGLFNKLKKHTKKKEARVRATQGQEPEQIEQQMN